MTQTSKSMEVFIISNHFTETIFCFDPYKTGGVSIQEMWRFLQTPTNIELVSYLIFDNESMFRTAF
jgi:hypothetical protein